MVRNKWINEISIVVLFIYLFIPKYEFRYSIISYRQIYKQSNYDVTNSNVYIIYSREGATIQLAI